MCLLQPSCIQWAVWNGLHVRYFEPGTCAMWHGYLCILWEKKYFFFCILHMLCVITSQGELEDDLDNRVGFFRGSPPVRTNNPLVHDLQFVMRASLLPTSAAIPLSPKGRKFSSAGKPLGRADGATSPLSDRNQKPGVRIEGFACDNSDFECCEQAPAPLPR